MNGRRDVRAPIAMAVVVVVWGSAFPAIGAGVAAYDPGHLVLLRFLVASGLLLGRAAVVGIRPPERRDWLPILAGSLTGVVGYQTALSYGQQVVSALSASLLVNMSPIFTVLLAAAYLRERLGLLGWVGVGVSFVGACVVSLADAGAVRLEPAALLVVFAAAAGAVYTVLQKPLLQRYRAVEYVSYVVWSGTAMLLVFAPGLVAAVRTAPLSATGAVVYLGVGPSIAGYVLFTYALSRLPASRVAPVQYLIPLSALGIAWVWLGEIPSALTLAGGAVSLVGVVVVHRWGARAPESVLVPSPTVGDNHADPN